MTIWPVTDVEEQPDITLRGWRVYETERGEHHFVRYCLENECGRVSSTILYFYHEGRTGVTSSGRRYVLLDEPGLDKHAQDVWRLWAVVNDVQETRDVSAQYLPSTTRRAKPTLKAKRRERSRMN